MPVTKHWIKRRAILARAGVAPRVQPGPQIRVIRQKCQLGAVSGLGHFRPILDLAERIQLFHSLEQRLVHRLVQFRNAQENWIGLSSLRPSGLARNVSAERECPSGRAVPAAIFVAVEITTRRPLQIAGKRYRQRLPCPRARFHDGVMMRFERIVHHLRHLQLSGPVFVVGADRGWVKPRLHALFEKPSRAKQPHASKASRILELAHRRRLPARFRLPWGHLRWAHIRARQFSPGALTFAACWSSAELDVRLARNPPLLSPAGIKSQLR